MNNQEKDWNPTATYTLAFLALIASFNFLDRALLGLVLPLIKKEMGLSDTILGLVSGLAFAIFYSAVSIPVAWLADRWNRRNIIAIGFAFWSVMTFLTGAVGNVWQLAATRFLMGAGEACGIAPSNAMIADLFNKSRRPMVMSLFGMANSFAFIALFPIAGWVSDHFGWRAAFFAAGAPGLVLAVIFYFTVREPARGEKDPGSRAADPSRSLVKTLRELAATPGYLFILLGATCMGANVYAASTWNTSFLVRVHHMSLTEIASTIGPLRGFLGGFGILLGGLLADYLGNRDPRWRLGIPALACILVAPSELLFLFGNDPSVWIIGLALANLLTLVHQGPIFAVTVNAISPDMRAVAVSILVMGAGLVGQVIGPLLVGWTNDQLNAVFGDESIRYSLIVVAVSAIGGGVSFLLAMRAIHASLGDGSEQPVL